MKLQPFSFSCFSVVIAASSASGATSAIYDFDASSSGDIFANGDVAGWSQDNPNPPSLFGTSFPLGYIVDTEINPGSGTYLFGAVPNPAGSVGTLRANSPTNATTTLSGVVDASSLTPTVPQVMMSLGIFDNSADAFVGRDQFVAAVIGLPGEQLASVFFAPTPGDLNTWDVSVSTNGNPATVTGTTVTANLGYTFTIDFGFSGTSFLMNPTSGGSPVTLSEESPVLSFGSRVNAFEMVHTPLGAAGSSANALVFDDLAVSVPEPGSSFLLVLGAGLLAARRRA